jgi:hypothetical protein
MELGAGRRPTLNGDGDDWPQDGSCISSIRHRGCGMLKEGAQKPVAFSTAAQAR